MFVQVTGPEHQHMVNHVLINCPCTIHLHNLNPQHRFEIPSSTHITVYMCQGHFSSSYIIGPPHKYATMATLHTISHRSLHSLQSIYMYGYIPELQYIRLERYIFHGILCYMCIYMYILCMYVVLCLAVSILNQAVLRLSS